MEVRRASGVPRGHMFYSYAGHHYANRERPTYGHLPSILRSEAEGDINHLLRVVRRRPLCLVYDGDISERRDLAAVVKAGYELISAGGFTVRNICEAAGRPPYHQRRFRT